MICEMLFEMKNYIYIYIYSNPNTKQGQLPQMALMNREQEPWKAAKLKCRIPLQITDQKTGGNIKYTFMMNANDVLTHHVVARIKEKNRKNNLYKSMPSTITLSSSSSSSSSSSKLVSRLSETQYKIPPKITPLSNKIIKKQRKKNKEKEQKNDKFCEISFEMTIEM